MMIEFDFVLNLSGNFWYGILPPKCNFFDQIHFIQLFA